MFVHICREAEAATQHLAHFYQLRSALNKPFKTEETICASAVSSCFENNAKLLIVLTNGHLFARISVICLR